MNMLTFLQCNLHRGKRAQDLLEEIRRENGADVLIISEQHHDVDEPTWFPDDSKTAAIWIPHPRKIRTEKSGKGNGYVWVQIREIIIVSCYLTPSDDTGEYYRKLAEIEDFLQETENEKIVAGDFNAKAIEWGEPYTNPKGRKILEMAARTGLVVLNSGMASTFRRSDCNETYPDISLATEGIYRKIANWHVIETENLSDHMYIGFECRTQCENAFTDCRPRWNPDKMDKGKMERELRQGYARIPESLRNAKTCEEAEKLTDMTLEIIARASDKAMPKKGQRLGKPHVYWWTDEIAAIRKTCNTLRRRAQRAREKPDHSTKEKDYKDAKKELRKAINRSKTRCWVELKLDIDRDPWGLGYKLVTRKLSSLAPVSAMSADTMKTIVDVLFPTHPDRENCETRVPTENFEAFTENEIKEAARSMKNKKAPGPDGIPPEAIKFTAQVCTGLLLDMYNACLRTGVFCARWKIARLVLIDKGKKSGTTPSSFRPLCMLDTAGKLLEKLLKPRLHKAIQEAGDLSNRQKGFRRGMSTVDAIEEVKLAVQKAWNRNAYSQEIVLLITLDVKNAFNSARWVDILEAMSTEFNVPEYLMRIIEDYLRDRKLQYTTTDQGQQLKKITAGAAQGSILGPDLWNVLYDGLLRADLPKEAFLVGYADDVAAVVSARTIEKATDVAQKVMSIIKNWMNLHGLELAEEKTEVVILSRRTSIKTREVPINLGDTVVTTRDFVKYLGIAMDTKLNFKQQIDRACEKAENVVKVLARLMSNVGGPRAIKRKLLMATTNSILLYGAEIWAEVLEKQNCIKKTEKVQRVGALRIACAYRTVSKEAILVIAGVTPISLLAQERQRIHQHRKEIPKEEAARQAKQRTREKWSERWRSTKNATWTRRLIKDLSAWVDRKHGEINYYVTQLLSGHGNFQHYLHKMGKVESPKCALCDSEKDDVQHTFFHCEEWKEARKMLEEEVGQFSPENIVELMLQSEENWTRIARYAETILRQKRGRLSVRSQD